MSDSMSDAASASSSSSHATSHGPTTGDAAATLFVGINRSVVALDAHTGLKRWSTELPGSAFSTGFVTVSAHGPHVYAAAAGEITCLDATTGIVLWHNMLEGYGIGFVTFATGHATPERGVDAANAAAAAASYTAAAGAAAAAGGVAAVL